MRSFNHSCQGESHKSTGKECQDYSLAYHDEEHGVTIAVVCDGHGGDSYFRSAVGARLAAEITVRQIRQFLADIDSGLFVGIPFTAVGTQETIEAESKLNGVMRRLFQSIYVLWREEITKDGQRGLTEWEEEHVEDKYRSLLWDEQRIVKAYGCTLMASVITKDYWLAFHLGDGKLVMLDSEYKFSQPVPWDEKCFLNKTTSLCGSEPYKDFRFCVQGDGHFPVAMFLGSDGLDDTFGEGSRLYSFYGSVIKELALRGQDAVETMLKKDLPLISKRGSQDDMSVAVVYDEHTIKDAAMAINQYQKELVQKDICDLQQKIDSKTTLIKNANEQEANLEKMKAEVRTLEANLKKMKIEARMAEKELAREQQQLDSLRERLKKLEMYTLQNNKYQGYEEES